jgi:hypothetical protein
MNSSSIIFIPLVGLDYYYLPALARPVGHHPAKAGIGVRLGAPVWFAENRMPAHGEFRVAFFIRRAEQGNGYQSFIFFTHSF